MGRRVPGFRTPLRLAAPGFPTARFSGAEVDYFGGLFCLLRFGAASE
jgi:hypothetical protein